MQISKKVFLIFFIFNIFAWPFCFLVSGDFSSMCIVVVPMWNVVPFLISLLLLFYEKIIFEKIIKGRYEEKRFKRIRNWIILIFIVVLFLVFWLYFLGNCFDSFYYKMTM